jgi:ribosome-associated toxin RatA of RatAB toxin-antitoxin module
MFEIVNDVEAYPRRFPWCTGARVLEPGAERTLARLSVRLAGMPLDMVTRNTLAPPSRIELDLVEGPFRAFRGVWRFEPLGSDGCKVVLELDFDFLGRFAGSVLARGFQRLADNLVDDFVRAAARP